MKKIIGFIGTFLIAYVIIGFLSTLFISVKFAADTTVWDRLRTKFYIAVHLGWVFKVILAGIYSVVVGRHIYSGDEVFHKGER